MFQGAREAKLSQVDLTIPTVNRPYADELLVIIKKNYGGSLATLVCCLMEERGLTDVDFQSGKISIVDLMDEAYQLLHPTGAEDSMAQANIRLR